MTHPASSSAEWQSALWKGMADDDDDYDSDTDSRLSGSMAVDSARRRLQRSYKTDTRQYNGDLQNHDGTDTTTSLSGSNHSDPSHMPPYTHLSSNGYPPGYSPGKRRPNPHSYVPVTLTGGSPKGVRVGVAGGRRDSNNMRDQTALYPYPGNRRKDSLLSPVPEVSSGGPANSSMSDVGVVTGGGRYVTPMTTQGLSTSSAVHRSMDAVHINRSMSMQARPPDGYRINGGDGYRVNGDGGYRVNGDGGYRVNGDGGYRINGDGGYRINGGSFESLPMAIPRRPSLGPTGSSSPYPRVNMGPTHSPQLSSRFPHGYSTSAPRSGFSSPQDELEQHVSSLGHSSQNPNSVKEPNLNDVIDFLSSDDPGVVIKAASYLQHLAFNDDNNKAKIRQYGGIQALVAQLCKHRDYRVHIAVLSTLRNLSYGRTNIENKLMIASDSGLPEMTLLLKTTQHPEVRELVTSILWNLSSSDELKMRLIHVCLRDMIENILIPHTGFSTSHRATIDFSMKPDVASWSIELRNSLGVLKNVSSAGEGARKFLRNSNNLIDVLVWIIRGGVIGEQIDEKTVENAVCVLRNLSFHLEDEIDLQDGADDNINKDWERQLQQEIEDANEDSKDESKKGGGFLLFCSRPRTSDNRRSKPRLPPSGNHYNPDTSLLPPRVHPVRGVTLLWQPELVHPYLALLDKYTSSPDLIEAAAGAIQNITACSWKWAAYFRHVVYKAKGLSLMIDLLNHSHDTVVRATATALRNLALHPTNKSIIGSYACQMIIPRLPYGQNNLGISDSTNVALLCMLMEVCHNNNENGKSFRDNGGIDPVVRLTHSREHTQRVVFAAHKLCAILYELKSCKSSLKHGGWDMREYRHLLAENSQQFNFERNTPYNMEVRRPQRGSIDKDKEKRRRSNSDPTELIKAAQLKREQQQQSGSSQPTQPSPHVTEIIPAYQSVPHPVIRQSSDTHLNLAPKPAPIGLYAEINDPDLAIEKPRKQSEASNQSRSDSRTQSRTGSHSEPRSSPIDAHTTTGSITPHDVISSDEQDPGTATYAQIDYQKKRESRRLKEQNKIQTSVNPTDMDYSWV